MLDLDSYDGVLSATKNVGVTSHGSMQENSTNSMCLPEPGEAIFQNLPQGEYIQTSGSASLVT